MKTYTILLLLIVLIVMPSCEKKHMEDPEHTKDTEYECEAIVMANLNNDTFIQCNKNVFELKFIKGEEIVRSLFDYDYNIPDGIYPALNLPDELRTTSSTIVLDVREPKPDEMPACYNFEMPVLLGPTVYVIRAEEK